MKNRDAGGVSPPAGKMAYLGFGEQYIKIYENAYIKTEDPILWELHEIRHHPHRER